MTDEVAKLLERYKELAHVHASTDYGDSRSVERANNAADEMAVICRKISLSGARGLNSFTTLLDEPAARTQLWAAHHILEHADYSEPLGRRALEIIRRYSEGSDADAYGERLWLKDWEAKRGKKSAPPYGGSAA